MKCIQLDSCRKTWHRSSPSDAFLLGVAQSSLLPSALWLCLFVCCVYRLLISGAAKSLDNGVFYLTLAYPMVVISRISVGNSAIIKGELSPKKLANMIEQFLKSFLVYRSPMFEAWKVPKRPVEVSCDVMLHLMAYRTAIETLTNSFSLCLSLSLSLSLSLLKAFGHQALATDVLILRSILTWHSINFWYVSMVL